jgi:hypothetical protein
MDEATREEIVALEEEYLKKHARYDRIKLWVLTYTAIVITVSFVILINLASGNRGIAEAIHSCVTPGERCYNAGQQRTADAIKTLNGYQKVVVALTVACGDETGHQSFAAINKCVDARLHALGLK